MIDLHTMFFPNRLSEWGLQPRIAPVCTGAGAGSGSTTFRRRLRRFRKRSGRLWCRARSGSTGFRRRFRRRFRRKSGRLCAEPGQVQQGYREGSGEGSGKPWCKAKSGSTGVPEKVPEKVPESLGAEPGQVQQGSGRRFLKRVPKKVPGGFGAEPGQVQQGSGEGSGEGLGGFGAEARSGSREGSGSSGEKSQVVLVQSQVRFNRVPEKVLEKVPEKVPGSLGAKPSQVQQGSREGSGEGRGGFGAEVRLVQSQVQQGSGEGSGEGSGKPWCKAKSGSTRFRRRFRRRSGRLWCRASQVQQGSGEGSGRLWCRARSGSTGFWRRFWRRFRRRSGRLWCRARSGSTGFRRRFRRRLQEALVQSQVKFNRVLEKVPALGFAARFRKICKNKTLRLLGIPPKLIFFSPNKHELSNDNLSVSDLFGMMKTSNLCQGFFTDSPIGICLHIMFHIFPCNVVAWTEQWQSNVYVYIYIYIHSL